MSSALSVLDRGQGFRVERRQGVAGHVDAVVVSQGSIEDAFEPAHGVLESIDQADEHEVVANVVERGRRRRHGRERERRLRARHRRARDTCDCWSPRCRRKRRTPPGSFPRRCAGGTASRRWRRGVDTATRRGRRAGAETWHSGAAGRGIGGRRKRNARTAPAAAARVRLRLRTNASLGPERRSSPSYTVTRPGVTRSRARSTEVPAVLGM